MPSCCRAQSSEARVPDDYDMDYDRGRVKKVRQKGNDADAPAESNRFQAAWSARGDRSSSLGPAPRGGSSPGGDSATMLLADACLDAGWIPRK